MRHITVICDHCGEEITAEQRATDLVINVRAVDGRSGYRDLNLHDNPCRSEIDIDAVVTQVGSLIPEPEQEVEPAAGTGVSGEESQPTQ